MTIQLVQQNHLESQIQTECINDLGSSNKSQTNSPNYNKNIKPDDNDQDYLKLYESNEKICDQKSPNNLAYSTILFLIKFFINFCYFIKLSLVHLYYVMFFLYEKLKYNDKKLDMDKIKTYAAQFKSMGIQIPKHVCIILNQNVTNENTVIEILSTIVDSLSIYGTETITFYQFTPFSTFVKDVINVKYSIKDGNNNDERNEINQPNGLRKRNAQIEENKFEYAKRNLNLHFLSNEQGGNSILVSACKNIATRVMNNQIDLKEINQDLIDSQVIGIFKESNF